MKALGRGLVIIALVIGFVPFLLLMLFRHMRSGAAAAPHPTSEEDIELTERDLNISIPGELREFFLDPAPAVRRACVSPLDLAEASSEFRQMTRTAQGPKGEAWPRSLFPFADLHPGYACLDLESRLIVEWDPEELTLDDPAPQAWSRSFRLTKLELAQWLAHKG